MQKFIIIFVCILCIGFNTYAADEGSVDVVQHTSSETEYTKELIGYKYVWKTKKVTVEKKTYLGKFWITHYCPCSRCCGVGGGKVTASGTKPTAGRTVGVNPKLIPYSTHLKVGKTSGYVAEDTGGGIGWKHLDIFCNSHAEALNAGVGWKKVWSVTYKTKKKKYKVKVPIYKWVEKEV